MNAIILTKNYETSSSAYHHQINLAFMGIGTCFLYGEGYLEYDKNDTIQDVITKAPFSKGDIDLIVVGTSWEIQDSKIYESDPHPRINLSGLNVPKVFFLNKEYKKLNQKLEYAKRNNFDLVCSAHHDYQRWSERTKLLFLHVPFATDPQRFKCSGNRKKYDFGFTGNLHRSHTDLRFRVKERLFKITDFNKSTNLTLSDKILLASFLKKEFKKYKIYWAEWKAGLPTGKKYVEFLSSFKTFLSTPSAIGLIGIRFFECMAVKTLIFCPESEYYGDLLKDGYNCVMFKEDLSDFADKLHWILSNKRERIRIVENAYRGFINKHTYGHRIEMVLKTLNLM